MPPRKRNKENTGLPARWTVRHGAIYYRVPPGLESSWDGKKMFRLGATLSEAHGIFSQRIGEFGRVRTMTQLLDRYQFEVVPKKKAATQKSNIISIKRLRTVFGDNDIDQIKASHAIQYRDVVTANNGTISANHDLSVLSHVFSKAIEWGLLENSQHPLRGLRIKNSKTPRRRYVTDDELKQAMTAASDFLCCYIALKGMTGLRKADLLSIRMTDIRQDGINVTPRKTASTTGTSKTIPMTPELDTAIKNIRAQRGKVAGMYLFCTRRGKPYIDDDGNTSGFDSIWQRFMAKVVALGVERFTEHDLRAKVASDTNAQHAQQLMDHANGEITEKVYRRKARIVHSTKGFGNSNDTVGDL